MIIALYVKEVLSIFIEQVLIRYKTSLTYSLPSFIHTLILQTVVNTNFQLKPTKFRMVGNVCIVDQRVVPDRRTGKNVHNILIQN